MPERWIGVVVASDKTIIVDVIVPDGDGSLDLQGDHSWSLQDGDRANAYQVMYKQVSEYVQEHDIKRVIIKASALSRTTKLAHLQAAELRGVVTCAAASVAEVSLLGKAHMSRTFGNRDVDEYVADNSFWSEQITGAKLRAGSREAAMVLLAARKKL